MYVFNVFPFVLDLKQFTVSTILHFMFSCVYFILSAIAGALQVFRKLFIGRNFPPYPGSPVPESLLNPPRSSHFLKASLDCPIPQHSLFFNSQTQPGTQNLTGLCATLCLHFSYVKGQLLFILSPPQ